MIKWHVIQSKPRKENFLQNQLLRIGLDVYYPCLKVKRVNPRAGQFEPYFPGYLFVQADIGKLGISTFRWMPGAIGIVCFGGEPAYLPDRLMDTLQAKINKITATHEKLIMTMKCGDKIKIQEGPFKGYEGIFKSHLAGNSRAKVLLALLQDRHISLDLPIESIQLSGAGLSR